ncbi:MAG: hypothetical protein ACREON_09725 [Gemmatimonadaceae bacterium]
MAVQPQRPRGVPVRVWSAITNRLPLKLAAIFFSLVLWLVVSAEEPTEEVVPVRVLLALDSQVTMRGPTPQARALVVGRGRELLKLYASPPVVRRAIGADVSETLTMELRPADVDIPPGVDARVRDVQPRTLVLRFDVTERRAVPVRVSPERGRVRVPVAREEPVIDTVHFEGAVADTSAAGGRGGVRRRADSTRAADSLPPPNDGAP